MAKFIIFLDRLIKLYLYFVVMACFLSFVPFLNPDYPLFNVIFKIAGFYFIPPIAGFAFGPAIILIGLALISKLLKEIYQKFFDKNDCKIFVLTPEQFFKVMENKDDSQNKEEGENK